MELTLYLENGKMLSFENVNGLERDLRYKKVIAFNYASVEDGKKGKVFFDIKNVIGISVDKEDFDVDSLFKA